MEVQYFEHRAKVTDTIKLVFKKIISERESDGKLEEMKGWAKINNNEEVKVTGFS